MTTFNTTSNAPFRFSASRSNMDLALEQVAETKANIVSLKKVIRDGKDSLLTLSNTSSADHEIQEAIEKRRTLAANQKAFLDVYDDPTNTKKLPKSLTHDDVEIIRQDMVRNNQIIVEMMSSLGKQEKNNPLQNEIDAIQSNIEFAQDELVNAKTKLKEDRATLRSIVLRKVKPLGFIAAGAALATSGLNMATQLMDTTAFTSMAMITGVGAAVSAGYNSLKEGFKISGLNHAHAASVGAFAGATVSAFAAFALPELTQYVTSSLDAVINGFNSFITIPETTSSSEIISGVIDTTAPLMETPIAAEISAPPTAAEFNDIANTPFNTPTIEFTHTTDVPPTIVANDLSLPNVYTSIQQPTINIPHIEGITTPQIETTPVEMTAYQMEAPSPYTYEPFSNISSEFTYTAENNSPNIREIETAPKIVTVEVAESAFTKVAPLETVGTFAMNEPSTFEPHQSRMIFVSNPVLSRA